MKQVARGFPSYSREEILRKMSLELIDIAIVVIYMLFILFYGIWVGRKEQPDREGFFLGGRNFSWLLIGTSLFATNINSMQFAGQSGLAYKIGIAAANPQLTGIVALFISALFFIPVYIRTRIFTIPGFLEIRYNTLAKLIYCLTLFVAGIFLTPMMLYLASLVIVQLMGLDEGMVFYCGLIFGLIVGGYAIIGGLASVVYTDFIQSVLLIVGGILVLTLGLKEVGGVMGLISQVEAQNLSLILPADHPEMPFTAVISGLMVLGIFWATSDQELLHRALGAKDTRNAQLGLLLGGFFKMIAVFIIVFPGIIASILIPDINPDRAYPALIQQVLPIGLSGLVLAGFIAAVMSSLDSKIMSLSSIFALDIYQHFDKNVDEAKALKVGRLAAFLLLALAIFTAPYVSELGLIYLLLQKVLGYLTPSVGVCYLVGRFNKRVNSFGAVFVLALGLVLGVFLLVFTTLPALKPYCPEIIRNANFFHISFCLSILYALILLIVSFAKPAPERACLEILEPSDTEIAHQKETTENLSILSSFKFWGIFYGLGIAGIFLLF